MGVYKDLANEIGELVDRKNSNYGSSFDKSGTILKELYPEGIKPEEYTDMLGVVRVIDKLFRIANGDKGDESAWQDIAGYGLLGENRNRNIKNCLEDIKKRGIRINTATDGSKQSEVYRKLKEGLEQAFEDKSEKFVGGFVDCKCNGEGWRSK